MGFWGSACEVGGVRVHTVRVWTVMIAFTLPPPCCTVVRVVEGGPFMLTCHNRHQWMGCFVQLTAPRAEICLWAGFPLSIWALQDGMSTGAQCVLCCSVFSELCCVSKQQHHSCLQSEEPEESVPSITCIQLAWSWHKTYYAGAGCMDRHSMHGDTVC